MGLEPRHRQAGEADELSGGDDLDRPQPEPVLLEAGLDVIDERVAVLPCESPGEVLHDLRVGVQRGELLPVSLSPSTQQQPPGAQFRSVMHDGKGSKPQILAARGPPPAGAHTWRMTRAGLPTASTLAGRSLTITAPAPTTVFSPMLTPGQTITPPPSHTLSAIVIGFEPSILARRGSGSRG